MESVEKEIKSFSPRRFCKEEKRVSQRSVKVTPSST